MLYMQRVSFDGSTWGSISSAGTVSTMVTAGTPENPVGPGNTESNVGASQQLLKKDHPGSPNIEFQLQQADVASWLSAMVQTN